MSTEHVIQNFVPPSFEDVVNLIHRGKSLVLYKILKKIFNTQQTESAIKRMWWQQRVAVELGRRIDQATAVHRTITVTATKSALSLPLCPIKIWSFHHVNLHNTFLNSLCMSVIWVVGDLDCWKGNLTQFTLFTPSFVVPYERVW